ncbi:MAG: HlyD family efflux transporter periplasmic adaptor subunit, partial [Verrucomicrobiota bacterium]
MQKIIKLTQFIRRQPSWRLAVALGILALIGWFFFGRAKSVIGQITFPARRGNLQISVLEGGSIEALESQEIRSEVKGGNGTKILKIVEEGYQVSDADVKEGKVLVELDSADLKQKITQQEISFQTTLSSLTEATQGYDIQLNQNKTDVKAAEQKAKFALMDLEKFMSDKATREVIAQLNLHETFSTNSDSGPDETLDTKKKTEGGGDVAATKGNTEDDFKPVTAEAVVFADTNKPAPIDYTKYAKLDLLGDGAAKQQLRKLLDDLQMAEQQQGLGKAKLQGTQRLFGKGFVTKTELETEEMTFKNNDLKIQTAMTARDLFIKYEFPKQAEELVSKYEEALRGLERSRKEAVSKLAQARARFKGAQGRYSIEAEQRKELGEQLEKCVIRAKKTGLVVYGGGNMDRDYYGGNEQIREGATVRERQPIITIPDMRQMALKVKIHESYIKKVSRGIKARIQVDAFPEEKLTGEVIKVAVLPDSQNRWMNADLKVYVTTISIDGSREWVKPGMSAKV